MGRGPTRTFDWKIQELLALFAFTGITCRQTLTLHEPGDTQPLRKAGLRDRAGEELANEAYARCAVRALVRALPTRRLWKKHERAETNSARSGPIKLRSEAAGSPAWINAAIKLRAWILTVADRR